jgi:hypothetical protein
VQILKVASKERDELMANRIKEMQALEDRLVKEVRQWKMEKEHLITEKDKLRLRSIQVETRIENIERERTRIKDHKVRETFHIYIYIYIYTFTCA